MAGFNFSSGGRRCIRPILENYQSGESEGYTVKSKEKEFPISNYPLEQTEFFYGQKQVRDKLENKKNRLFDYSMFNYRVVRLFFDILHGIKRMDVPLIMVLELLIFLGFDGKLEVNSEMEKDLFVSAIDQLKATKMTKVENALIWLYLKTWGKFGDHVIKEKDLWNFSGNDLETVIMSLAFPRKKEKTERAEALTDLIMEKFEQDGIAFREWAAKVHAEVIETLPETIGPDAVDRQVTIYQQQPSTVVKIYEWDSATAYRASVTNGIFKSPGNYSSYARAKNVMSTQSETDFEWSVKLFSTLFDVGIASKLEQGSYIVDTDRNAILYYSNGGTPIIQSGGKIIHSNLGKQKNGDVVRFRFKPQTKKLLINLNGQIEIDLKDNVNYFPVVQSRYDGFEAHLID